jgi:hypothetical protein
MANTKIQNSKIKALWALLFGAGKSVQKADTSKTPDFDALAKALIDIIGAGSLPSTAEFDNLQVTVALTLVDGKGEGKILVSDANGKGVWTTNPNPTPYTLPSASTTVKGGVSVPVLSGLDVDTDGILGANVDGDKGMGINGTSGAMYIKLGTGLEFDAETGAIKVSVG